MIKSIKIIFLFMVYLVFAVHILFWSMVIFRIAAVPENHIGIDIRIFNYVSYGLIGLVLVTGLVSKKFYLFFLATALALASLGGVYYVDKNNLLVQYDEWTSRGMPEKGSVHSGPRS